MLGLDVNDEQWTEILEDDAHAKYVLQRVVEQHLFPLLTAQGWEEKLMVGLLHNFNDLFLGPGSFVYVDRHVHTHVYRQMYRQVYRHACRHVYGHVWRRLLHK